MSFDTPDGTRGGRQPRAGRLLRMANKWVMSRARIRGRVVGPMTALVLTTVGRKTGVERSTPVSYFPDKEGGWLIVASGGGAPKNPAWYKNMAAHPDDVKVEMAGRTISVTAAQLHGQERDAAWQQVAAAVSQYRRWQKKTDREIPVIRLVPRSG